MSVISQIGPLNNWVPIVDDIGRPLPEFIRYFTQLFQNTSVLDGAKQNYSDLLTAIAALSGTGFITQTGTGTVAERTITATSPIVVTNGSGVSGNPSITHATSGVTAGTYGDATHSPQITVDNKGHITAVTNTLITGGGGGGSAPTVRASTITSSSNSSYSLNWPTGTVAGDLVVLFGGHGFGINLPSGWIQLDNSTGSNCNGAVFIKVMTSSDISTGHVTVTTGGSFDGCFALVTVTGSTATGFRLPGTFIRSSSGATSVPLYDLAAFNTDLILAFEMTRGNIACTFSSGFTSLQSIATGNASGAVANFTGTVSAMGPNETGTFASSGTGYYTAVIAIHT